MHEAVTPFAQGAGVVQTEGELVHHFQTGAFRFGAEGRRAGQAAARKHVLLDEVGAADVALEQLVLDHDALDAGLATRLEQARDRLEIGRPVLATDRLDHLDRADGVVRAILDVAIVLQTQVGLRHALPGVGQLLGRQGHPGHRGTEFGDGLLGQGAPAAANLQHTVAGLDTGQLQGAAHLGVLGRDHVLFGRLEPGRRVVHGRVQPELVERVAQVVVGMDVLAAVGARVAVELVAHPVGQATEPGAVDHVFEVAPVGQEQAQQVGEVAGAPVTREVALGKADVTRFERRAAGVPVVQVQGGVNALAIAEALQAAVGQLQGQAAVLQALQQLQDGAGGGRRVGRQRESDGVVTGGGAVHGGNSSGSAEKSVRIWAMRVRRPGSRSRLAAQAGGRRACA